jgi:protease-4
MEMQVFRHGRYKSAVEPFLNERMSAENRFQSEAFLQSMWNTMLREISVSRKLDAAELNRMADDLTIKFPSDALGKFVDSNGYEDEVHDAIKNKLGMKATEKLKFVELSKYQTKPLADLKSAGNRIAVIYARGSINSGEGADDEIGSAALARTIREARLDDKVKAIVLRVNSPGGSAIASEVIWREMMLAGKKKTTVVSMGDVAASGGYYIACGAHRIFAQPNTITGSIGVFGLVPNIERMMKEKLGITFDTVNTNRHSDAGTGLRKLNAEENAYIQALIERIYSTFTQRVAEGRKMSVAEVDSIGQGRVWSGEDAMKKNLVDEMGGLNDAIAWAAKKAGLKEHRIVELPRQKGPFEALLGNKDSEAADMLLKENLGETYTYFRQAQSMVRMKGIQARMPFEIDIR